jgi:hypothetical protein
MTADELLTIRQVAAALNLSDARVHQLVAEGLLDCVSLPSGRKRHAPGSRRVTSASVERLRLEREAAARVAVEPRARRRGAPDAPTAVLPAGGGELEVAAARAAALELKVRLDSAREQVRNERERADRLLDVAAQLVELLRHSSRSANGLDELAEAYSSALTQLLAPGTAPE